MVALYILATVLVLGILTFIHELGHFIFARVFGVPVLEFAIGMGPKIASWTGKNGTKYALRLFPIGGFVSMDGEEGVSSNPKAFNNINPWKKIVITVAGATFNIIFAVILMFILVISSKTLGSTTVSAFNENSLSSSKLVVGDEIIKVGSTRVHTGEEVFYEIMSKGYEAIDITVKRDGKQIVVEDVVFPTINENGVLFGDIDFKLYTLDSLERVTVFDYLKQAFYRSYSAFKMIWDSLIGLISGRFGISAVSGPVGIVEVVGEAVGKVDKNTIPSITYLVVVISMNLGVFNLLPIPALDGGRIVFHLVDAVAGKKVIKKETEDMIHAVGIMILFAFMILISFKDVFTLFR